MKRRLAQNREAARKSRQRRKAYVQNLEEEVRHVLLAALYSFLSRLRKSTSSMPCTPLHHRRVQSCYVARKGVSG